jgi:4-amino-4-deoxy-L-arabinose transferase-like glycosyltransferase
MNRQDFGKLFSGRGFTGVVLLLILLLNFSIRWRFLDLPLERDEGEYAYSGQLILQGIPPYLLAYNLKFPGVYFAYAGLMSLFGQTPGGIHGGIILVTSLSIGLIFLIGCELMDAIGGLVAAAFFTALCAMPYTYGLAGHATHFVVLCVCLGSYALLRLEKSRTVLWTAVAGVAFGSAILMKQHAVFFAAAAGIRLLWFARAEKLKGLRVVAVFTTALILPVAVTFLGLACAGVWSRFNQWTIHYATDYISICPISALPRQFNAAFSLILEDGTWVWLFGLAGIGLVFLSGPYRRSAVFGTGLLLAGAAATVPGFYFRGHYFLMVMPGIALLNAALLRALAGFIRERAPTPILRVTTVCLFLVVSGDLAVRNIELWFQYPPALVDRILYGDNPFPESAEIARYIAAHTRPADTIAVLGSEPQIFFLAHRHSASGYIYLYPLTEPQPLAASMRSDFFREIETNRPAYVVYVNAMSSWISTVIPGQPRQLIDSIDDWWQPYAAQNYRLVGQVDIPDGQPPQYYWDDQMASRTNIGEPSISIFRHK